MQEVPIKRALSPDELEAIGDLSQWGEGGLRIKGEPARYYPEDQLAAHVLGFVNRDQEGLEGIEALYDSYLRAIPGKQKSRVDGKRSMLLPLTLEYKAPEGGGDLYLTIDKPIQHILERELANVMELRQASGAMGIVMDPKTGAVLAMATLPYDPNAPAEYPQQSRVNAAVSFVFEPGSAFRFCPSRRRSNAGLLRRPTCSIARTARGMLSGFAAFATCTRWAGLPSRNCLRNRATSARSKSRTNLSPRTARKFDTWIRNFGFGKKTGNDFRYESAGFYHPDGKWTKFSEISLPMGQEIAVTMPQLARAFAAIANGGVLVEPHLVDHVKNYDGEIVYRYPAQSETHYVGTNRSDHAGVMLRRCRAWHGQARGDP